MTRLPTPTEELEIRQQCEEAWRLTWANATDLTPRQAFIEGHYLAIWSGVLACRATHKESLRRMGIQLTLSLLALVAAIGWGVLR